MRKIKNLHLRALKAGGKWGHEAILLREVEPEYNPHFVLLTKIQVSFLFILIEKILIACSCHSIIAGVCLRS